jgi:glycine/D-amino acid oxidase-like deaminating enzyme
VSRFFKLEGAEIAVIGSGLMGSSAAYYLSKMGAKVILINSGQTGGSAGFSRIIRQTAYENADFFPKKVIESNLEWQKIAQENSSILQPRKCLIIGNNPSYINPAITAAVTSKVDHKTLNSADLQKLYPFLNAKILGGIEEASMHENGEGAAILNPALAIKTMHQLILQQGGEIISNMKVEDITENLYCTTIRASDGRKAIFDRVIVAANAWTPKLLPGNNIIQNALTPKIAKLFYFEIAEENRDKFENFPTMIFKIQGGDEFAKNHPKFVQENLALNFTKSKTSEGLYLMTEEQDGKLLLKVGHTQPDPKFKESVDDMLAKATVSNDEKKFVESFVKEFLPGVAKNLKSQQVSMSQVAPLTCIADNMPIISPIAPHSRIIASVICCTGIGAKIALECGNIAALHAIDRQDLIDPKIRAAFSIERESLRLPANSVGNSEASRLVPNQTKEK